MAHIMHDPNACPDGRTTMELGAVLPITAEVRGSHLFVGGVDMAALARRQGTALYVMDVAQIKQQLRTYKEALGSKNRVAYAGKAFLNKAMVRILAAEDSFLDVSSGGELAIALSAGFDPAHIIVHGNNKTEIELAEAIEAGVGLIVADCFEELNRISHLVRERGAEQTAQSTLFTQSILLRIKPGIVADTHEFIRTGAEDSKFGFGISDGMATRAVELALSLPGIQLKGLGLHIGSQILSLAAYKETVEVMADFCAQLQAELDFVPEFLDMGGGLGTAYQATDEPPTIRELVTLVTSQVQCSFSRQGLATPTLIIEPGRSIVAIAGLTLYTVGAIKDIRDIRCFVAIDGGMSDNIRTALYDARYEAVVANKADRIRDALVTLAGKHCESGDVVAIDVSIQTPEVGDIVAVFGTGAYNATMSSNYNAQVRPAVVFVENGETTLVQRRETYADLMVRDV